MWEYWQIWLVSVLLWVLHFLLGTTRKTLPSNGVLLNHMSVWYYNVFCSLRDDGVMKDWISCHVK